jgi:hypothetical protein
MGIIAAFFETLTKYEGKEYLARLLSYNASPVMKKIKPAVLLNIHFKPGITKTVWRQVRKHFAETCHVSIRELYCGEDRCMILVYDALLLQNALSGDAAKRILRDVGYGAGGMNRLLGRLCTRCHMERCPHEIGLFLGYPPEDVAAFIHHNGANFIRCGAWKVYGDVAFAERKWGEWRAAKENMARVLLSGVSCHAAVNLI